MDGRVEFDALGQRSIPDGAYWGIHTGRAVENFSVSSRPVSFRLIAALAVVKKAACQANAELGYLKAATSKAIQQACDEIIAGKWKEQFPLDALQGGAGTSTHMNVNEVLANRALEILGYPKGRYDRIDPIEHVNLHQSTNDVYPTALKVAALWACRELAEGVAGLQDVLQVKEKQFASVIKIGRTEYQEAVPTTLGTEFSAFAEAVARDRWRVSKCEERLRVTNLGGTAIGSGLGAPRRYIFLVIEKLRQETGLGLSRSENLAGDTAFVDPFVEVSGILKAHACNLSKIAGDLRLMGLLGEIHLPKAQAGSSIMPGKINPVILECAIQATMQVRANDAMIAECISRGTLQICEFLPMVAAALLESLDVLIRIDRILARHIAGIEADPAVCRRFVEESPTVLTALLPKEGYRGVEKLVQEFLSSGIPHWKTFLEKKLGRETVEEMLSPARLTQLGYLENGKSA